VASVVVAIMVVVMMLMAIAVVMPVATVMTISVIAIVISAVGIAVGVAIRGAAIHTCTSCAHQQNRNNAGQKKAFHLPSNDPESIGYLYRVAAGNTNQFP
jgi:hypothetical protein